MNSLRDSKTTINVAAYARVSTDTSDQANSFESQVKYFSEYINKQQGWNLVKVYSDDGVSGTSTKKRPGFTSMIDDALSGKIDLILTKELSRFSRNVSDTIQYTRMLKEHNVDVIFSLDGIDTRNSESEFKLTIFSALAQEESRKTSERVKWGQKRQMEKGVVFGRDLLGYKVEKGVLYLVQDEANIVRLIFHKYLDEGKGAHIIARELKEKGIKPYNPDGCAKYKNDWTNTQILRILRNEKYVGDLCQKKTYTKSFLDHKKYYNKGQEEMIYIKDHHPEIAIISRDIWDATQAELQRRSKTAEQKSKHSNRYWASGKVFCGVCGERFVRKTKKTTSGNSNAWICMNHVKATPFRTAQCSMKEWANDRSLKSIVLYVLNTLIEYKEDIKQEIISDIASLKVEKNTSYVSDIQKKIDRLEQKKGRLIDIRLSNEISQEDFQKKLKEMEVGISKLCKLKESVCIEQDRQCITTGINAEISNFLELNGKDMDLLLGTVTQSITIYENHIVVVQLKDVPYAFRIAYKSTGKLDSYRTEILSLDVI